MRMLKRMDPFLGDQAHAALIRCAAVVCLFMSSTSSAQSIIAGDSLTRRVAPRAIDSVRVALRDGDYARLTIAHPLGLDVRVIRPSGEELRLFALPSMKGLTPIAFVAEGAGSYTVTAKNTGEALTEYGLKFDERASLDERTRPASIPDGLTSPRIDGLRRRVQSGETSTAQFWSQLAVEGTPIVEPLDATYDLVTFVWRTQYDTRNVCLRASFGRIEGVNDALRLIPGTDVWYLTEKLPKGARFTYHLEPNRPASPTAARVSAQLDPLNRGPRSNCPPGASRYRCRSIGVLPEVPPEPWIVARPSVPQGAIEKRSIRSDIQQVTRDLTVYTPAGYSRRGKPLPLVVLFDGADYLEEDWHGPAIWNNLIAERRVSPMVIVMVHNLPGRRLFDLVANEKFGRFMAAELVPWARREYNVARDAGQTVAGGASAGGFAATYLGIAHPEVFGNVLSISGAFWWSPEHNGGICGGACPDSSGKPAVENADATTEPNWLAQLALKRPASKARFYLSAGTFEVDRDAAGSGILEENRHLRDILRAKRNEVIFNQFVGGHDQVVRPGAMADGLQKLLPPHDR
jgi:enterochelin esterase-like enzyme